MWSWPAPISGEKSEEALLSTLSRLRNETRTRGVSEEVIVRLRELAEWREKGELRISQDPGVWSNEELMRAL